MCISFFFNGTPPAEIYTLSLHDALPILWLAASRIAATSVTKRPGISDLYIRELSRVKAAAGRSEEHTSELQSRVDLVCRLLLEKKKMNTRRQHGVMAAAQVDTYHLSDSA